METTYVIKKAKMKDRVLIVDMTEIIMDEGVLKSENEINKKCDQLVHDDLISAFEKLKIHVALICDMKEAQIVNGDFSFDEFDSEQLPNIKITGFVIAGDNEHEGVVIIASKTIGTKVLNIITPFVKYEDEEYMWGGDLSISIQGCVYEVEQYLFNNKVAIKNQLEMSFDEGFEDESIQKKVSESDTEPEIKSRKRNIKKVEHAEVA